MGGAGGIYERFGVVPVINAAGPQTRLSGGIMAPEVSAAMAEASRVCVDIAELQAAASEVIARVTGAEAGCVTAGGAAALMLGAAACMTGLDVERMNRLPDVAGLPHEFLVSRSQRNMYDRAVRQAGGRLVEVGVPDRFTGAGVRDAEPWHFESAVTERTAGILWFAQRNSEPDLRSLVRIAQAYRLTVLVDAASQLPPRINLRRFTEEGADLVAFSGGKAIGGPQASGLLAGRRDLVLAAVLQMLDHDLFPEFWRPRGRLFEDLDLPTLPDHGIGRPAKAGKEEIVGLLVALDAFAGRDERATSAGWRMTCEAIAAAIGNPPHAAIRVGEDPRRRGAFFVELDLDEAALGRSAFAVASALQDRRPSVRVNHSRLREGVLLLNPMCVLPGQVIELGRSIAAELIRQ